MNWCLVGRPSKYLTTVSVLNARLLGPPPLMRMIPILPLHPGMALAAHDAVILHKSLYFLILIYFSRLT
jgi:hypothetical protein